MAEDLHNLFEKLGEINGSVREMKHAANNLSQKVESVNHKVDTMASTVLKHSYLEECSREHDTRISILEADKLRREGAIGLVEWISKNYPVVVLFAGIVLWVGFANGTFG